MLPLTFTERMRTLLGGEADAFFRELEKPDSIHGLRVNPEKISKETFAGIFPYPLAAIPYAEDGYLVETGKLGNTPYHHAGMIYLQDPAAMSTMHALTIRPGSRVLDVCAAPGGKSGQAAAYVGEGGLLVSNEYVTARSKILAGNLERLGCRNTVTLNVDAKTLGEFYPAYFDLVIVDAPCSGEGMFRKSAEAVAEWSEENVRSCAVRQSEILDRVAGCVAQDGQLLYSTCTYSVEENEEIVERFLQRHPEFRILPVNPALDRCTAPGIVIPGGREDLRLTRRFYPHLCPGEGQYVALLGRTEGEKNQMPAFREPPAVLSREEERVVTAFFREFFREIPPVRLVKLRDTVFALPKEMSLPPFGVVSAGVPVGMVTKGRLEPHHHLFSAFGRQFRIRLELDPEGPLIGKYLHGETIPAPDLPDGWGVVTVAGAPLGGVKIVGGTAKNHYPKGLRIP